MNRYRRGAMSRSEKTTTGAAKRVVRFVRRTRRGQVCYIRKIRSARFARVPTSFIVPS